LIQCGSQDKYGEVCPANWHKGEKTIKADPKASLEYFSAAQETNGKAANGTNGTNGAPAAKRARVD
jgi:peroxiredoxin (alkyl hydroperoxide reductase subunit C)